MISSIYEYGAAAAKNATIAALVRGPIPRHVGFILDGNRRFARKVGASNTKFGHYEGFKHLKTSVTVFAFSIENFKRSEEEVAYLMQLFREAFAIFSEKNELVDEYQIGIRVCGHLSYLPPDVAELAHKVMDRTKHNTARYFNICCPYTSRDEMTTAIKENVRLVEQNKMSINDITEESIHNHLYTSASPPLDILVRTSGEIRLSDFLLWQASDQCQIQLLNCFWPELTFWKFLPILLEYQIYHSASSRSNNNNTTNNTTAIEIK
ncbi:di-trans,poly-cis-decaprenylcistransferase [Zychaea mexicana]|uniref:di-trans,poly-cis-decaprenylcistransferase n=1 Tax=Zychaea mexicana TaxID=64656 RepID=UPI0022FE4FFA|nr:di-trans,poly-cis-decaprenylcistransferase [Zychaea mexicana]KAI9489937.1 di-trans,poly-cis-decaprenylcistransferase [Zychaea mexicana]